MFIQIKANLDGSHAFQIGGNLEDGWAVVPDSMTIPDTFPFVNIETGMVTHPAIMDESGKVLISEYTQLEVISMAEGEEIQVEEHEIEPLTSDTVTDAEAAEAIKEGVNSV